MTDLEVINSTFERNAGFNLSEKYGGVWAIHPDYPVNDWQYEVMNADTRQGYWDWVVHRILGDSV